jgi:hypothetical protein
MPLEEARKRMKAQPFSPIPNLSPELRIASALEYTAYYLGEIESHLSKIAAHAEPNTANLSKIAGHVQGIGHMLPTLLAKK